MAKRITTLNYLLGIAFFAFCGVAHSAQDSAQSTAIKKAPQAAGVLPLSPPASPDTARKAAVGKSVGLSVTAPVPDSATKAAAQAVVPDTLKKATVNMTSASQPSAPAAAPPAKTTQALQKTKPAGEDILDEEDLILPEKGADLPVKKAAGVDTAKSAETTPGKTAAVPAGDTGRLSADTSAAKAAASSPASQHAAGAAAGSSPTAGAPEAKSSTKSVVIEDARPINFARNLKEYRSPKLAMLLSLIVPGLGQAYIGRPLNYVKAGAYFAVEAAIIGVSAYYNSKGNNEYNQAKNYANSYFSYDSMVGYYNQLFGFLQAGALGQNNGPPDSVAQATLNGIYIDTLGTATSSFTKFYNKGHPTQDYYHTIENPEYVQGWKGCEPTIADIKNTTAAGDTINNPGYRYLYQRGPDSSGSYLVNLIDRTTGKIVPGTENQLQYGYSPYQRTYNSMMSESNKFYKTATYVLFVILVNHVASAVDALISAKSFNDWLLGRQTFWDKVSLEPTTAFSGSYLSPGLTMTVNF
jgi:hypothetical protein